MIITILMILGFIGYFGLKALALVVGIGATLFFIGITIALGIKLTYEERKANIEAAANKTYNK